MLIKAQESCLLIVDVQRKLLPATADPAAVIKGCAILMRAARRLGIPLLVSEQYPKGIGPTVPELRDLAPEGAVMEKLHFSCGDDPAINNRLRGLGRPQVVIAGIEAHVCVLQTALRFRELGFEVFVAGDACASRDPANARAAIQRLRQSDVQVASTEMVVFEWLNCAGTPEFKELMTLIK